MVERYSGPVFRTARRILGDDGESEEVTQAVFLEVYHTIEQFDPKKGTFLSWLLRKARYRAINHRIHLGTERFYDWTEIDELLPSRTHNENTQFQAQEIGPMLDELLGKLLPETREVLSLTFYEGLTAQQIAEQTKSSVHIVRHKLYEGLKELRRLAGLEQPTVKKRVK